MFALKLSLVAGSVLLASLVSRRFGHTAAGMLAGLPMIAGPIMGLLLIDLTPEHAGAVALATLAALPAMALHFVVFGQAAKRWRWPMCLLLANGAFLAAGAVLMLQPPRPWATGALAFLAPALVLRALADAPGHRTPVPLGAQELALRVSVALILLRRAVCRVAEVRCDRKLCAGLRGGACCGQRRIDSQGVRMSAYELAQLNIGRIKGPMDSPVMADFAANLDRINALAEQTPGFVWRLQTEEGDATSIRPFEDKNMLVNMSVWRDVESLSKYVYSSAHMEIMRRRREWFERMQEALFVLWWVPKGHRPSVTEAIAKLDLLRAKGPTAEAFTFGRAFLPPDAAQPQAPRTFGEECPAS